MNSMDAVEDIKQRLSIEDVAAEYVELKRAGRNFKGLSPFNPERSPSFIVSPEKQIWHDFSSGKGGDAFAFVMEMEGVDFKGSLEILARKTGIDLSLYQRGDGGARKKKDQAGEVLTNAVKYYQQSLLQNKEALDYVLKKRGMRRQTITDFGIGYSPNTGHALIDVLKKKGFSQADARGAGLLAQRYSGDSDMFRGRVMIPLMDAQGNPIGFTARLLTPNDKAPKYINTPQTILYDKSRHVFGLHLAKDAIRTEKFIVIVEGNMDVISSHQAGVKNVVATAGTALTTYQLKTLQRFTNDIRLCFDQDKAGIAAAERAIDVAQSIGVQLSIISIPEGKDPDELIQKDSKLWQKAINEQQYSVDWLIDRYKEQYDIKTAAGKKKFSDVLALVVSRLQDSVEQDHYVKLLAKVTNVAEPAIRSKLEYIKSGTKPTLKKAKAISAPVGKDNDSYQDKLLALLVMYPITRRTLETSDDVFYVFSTPERQRVFQYLTDNTTAILTGAVPEDLKDVEDYVKILVVNAEDSYAGFDANQRLRELQDLSKKLKTEYFRNKMQLLTARIKEAEDSGDEAKRLELLKEHVAILKKGI